MPSRQQAIIWINADSVHRRIYVALGGEELRGGDTIDVRFPHKGPVLRKDCHVMTSSISIDIIIMIFIIESDIVPRATCGFLCKIYAKITSVYMYTSPLTPKWLLIFFSKLNLVPTSIYLKSILMTLVQQTLRQQGGCRCPDALASGHQQLQILYPKPVKPMHWNVSRNLETHWHIAAVAL